MEGCLKGENEGSLTSEPQTGIPGVMPTDRHRMLSSEDRAAQNLHLAGVRAQVSALWGGEVTWTQLAVLAGLAPHALKPARAGRAISPPARTAVDELPAQMTRIVQGLPGEISLQEAPRWVASPRLSADEQAAVARAAALVLRMQPGKSQVDAGS